MCKLYHVCVVCVFVLVLGYGVAEDYTRESRGNTQFIVKRIRRHNHNRRSQENHQSNKHREPENRRHEQLPSDNAFQHHNDQQPNLNYLHHSDSGDRFRPTTTVTRQNNMDRPQHYSNEFNQQPTKNHHSFQTPPHNHERGLNGINVRNQPPDLHDQGSVRQMNNQHHDYTGSRSEMLEQPRSLHGQKFKDTPVTHHHQADRQESHHESQTHNHRRIGGEVQRPSPDDSQNNEDESNYFSSNHTQRHEGQRGKNTNEEVITERSLQEKLVQEENLQLHSPRDQNNTRSNIEHTVIQPETNPLQTTTTPTTTTIPTTHKSNTSLPHIPNLVVITAPDRACDKGMERDFTNTCRIVYITD